MTVAAAQVAVKGMGSMTELGEMTRTQDKNVVHTRCAATGTNECLWSVTWRP